MTTNDSNLTVTTTTAASSWYTVSFFANRIKFWILFTLQLCAVPCYLYIFYKFAYKKRLFHNIQHHVTLLLLIVSFLFVTINLSLSLSYMYTSYVYPSSDLYCTLWNWFHYSLNIINLFLMGFASLERNWLIFYPKLTAQKYRRFLFHYCPLIFCVIYPPFFYFAAMFIHKCQAYYDYTQLLCTWPCYFYNLQWTNFDLFFNNYTPLCSIPVFCCVLYIRVLVQKNKLKQQRFKWKRDKKLILQLWSQSSLYLAMWMPLQLAGLINLYLDPLFLLQDQITYMYLFPYLIHLLYPAVILISFHHEIPSIRKTTGTVVPMQTFRITNIK